MNVVSYERPGKTFIHEEEEEEEGEMSSSQGVHMFIMSSQSGEFRLIQKLHLYNCSYIHAVWSNLTTSW